MPHATRNPSYDLYIDRMDGWFGHPSFVLGHWLLHHVRIEVLLLFSYDLLPVAVIAF